MEKFFGNLTSGMAFGESCLLHPYEDQDKFYNSVAMCTTEVLQIDLLAYRAILQKQQSRILAEKMSFIKNIPELEMLVASKQRIICENMFQVSFVKDALVHRAGEPCNQVLFINKGEVKVCKKVTLGRRNAEESDVLALLHDG